MLTRFLAEATPKAAEFFSAAGVLYWLSFMGANMAIIAGFLWGHSKKQKREVSFTQEPVSKHEFKEHVKHNTDRHAQLFREIETVQKAANEARTESARCIAALEKETERQNQWLERIDAKLDLRTVIPPKPR